MDYLKALKAAIMGMAAGLIVVSVILLIAIQADVAHIRLVLEKWEYDFTELEGKYNESAGESVGSDA